MSRLKGSRLLYGRSASGRRRVGAALAITGLSAAIVVGALRPWKARNPTPAASALPVLPKVTGFAGTYFRDESFQEVAFTRTDPSIAFDWGSEGPAGLPPDHFSVRWTGSLRVDHSGNYVFFMTSDDGSRLTIDDTVVVDDWNTHAAVPRWGTIELRQGVHGIRIEYFEATGGASMKLEWEYKRLGRNVITSDDLL